MSGKKKREQQRRYFREIQRSVCRWCGKELRGLEVGQHAHSLAELFGAPKGMPLADFEAKP